MAITTIQLSTDIKRSLERMKIRPRETYNDVLERLIEDVRELDESALTEIESARAEIRGGRHLTQEQVRKTMGLW